MKDKFKEICYDAGLEPEELADFIRNVMETCAEHVQATEPHATATIRELRNAGMNAEGIIEEVFE